MSPRNLLIGLVVVSIAGVPILRETGLWDEWFSPAPPAPIPSLASSPTPSLAPSTAPQKLDALTRRMKAALNAQNPGAPAQPLRPLPPSGPTAAGKSGQIRLYLSLGSLDEITDGSEANPWVRLVLQENLFSAATTLTNDLIALDRDLIATFKECGEANAWYSPSERTITFCSELLARFAQLFGPYAKPREELVVALRGAALFVYLHEIGHAMVREMNIPIVGNEEIAVDQFATLLLLQLGSEGEQAVLSAAIDFQLSAAAIRAGGHQVILWDEHPLDEQRFFNLACWIYGANPYRNVHLVARGALPERRAARCGDEYQQLHNSWKTLLDGKLKHPLK